jgi:large subunit ribosomal protein L1
MGKKSKLYRRQVESYDGASQYELDKAVSILKQMPHVKFDESVDLSCKLGVDPRQSDQVVRGAIPLPHGTGKVNRVVVIATGEAAEAAREAGADEVGFDEVLEKIKGGWIGFDTLIATPQTMQKVRTLGRFLGPRGLMPNPKTGTVTEDTGAAVREAKAGRVEFRADRTACCHVPVGRVSFDEDALVGNINAVLNAVIRARPPSTKGDYLLSCTLSSTMGPGIKLDPNQFERS